MRSFASTPFFVCGLLLILLALAGCSLPSPEKKKADVRVKHNNIVLLDLSDRLIVQENQHERVVSQRIKSRPFEALQAES
jgi:hypothetical protein